MPKVSICLPVYNGEKYLAEAIESVLGQTFNDFELLIADDCSTDSSATIVESYARKDPRIVFWRNDSNLGLFDNYNESMGKASAPLIKPFAQDDLWEPSLLSAMTGAFEQHQNLALAACNRKWIDEAGNELPLPMEFTETTVMSGVEIARRCLSEFINWIGEPSTVMFPKKYMGSGFDGSYHHLGDLEYWIRIALNGNFLFTAEPLCKFRRHSQSTTNKNITGLRFAIDMLRMAEKTPALLPDNDLETDDIKLSAISGASSFVHYLSELGQISLAELLAQTPKDEESARRMINEYKELAYYSLVYAARREEAWAARLQAKQDELHEAEQAMTNILDSRTWRLANGFQKILKPRKQ